MSKFKSARDIVGFVSDMFRPPVRLSVSECAEEHFRLTDGSRYLTSTTPYMKEAMDLVASREFTTIVFTAPARTGKSLALVDATLVYIIKVDPSDTLLVCMTEQAARRISKLRIAKMIRNSPAIKKLLSPVIRDDGILMKTFRNGMSLVIGSPTPTQLSASDYKYVILSDYDRMPLDTGEGSPYILGSKRTATFASAGQTIVEASVGFDLLDPKWKDERNDIGIHEAPPVIAGVMALYNEGDRRVFYWTCPHCAESFPTHTGLDLFCLPPTTELMQEIQESSPKNLAMKYDKIWCPHCGAGIEHSQKRSLNIGGKWMKEDPSKEYSTASFWLTGLPASFQTWRNLLEKEFSALEHYMKTGDETKLKATRNVDQNIPYTPIALLDSLSSRMLQERSTDLGYRIVPLGVRYLVTAVDVQKFKFVVQVEGVGLNDERWIIDRFDISQSNREINDQKQLMQPATYIEDWDKLDRVINRYYKCEVFEDSNGELQELEMRSNGVVCDSGGAEGTTENAYKYWKKQYDIGNQNRLFLIKGVRPKPNSITPIYRETILDKASASARKARVVGKQKLYIINTTILKDTVIGQLKRREVGAGYVHFPNWLPETFYKELVAETRDDNGWDNKKKHRNESFDLMAYCRVGERFMSATGWQGELKWDAPPSWALPWLDNVNVRPVNKEVEVETVTKVSGTKRMVRKVRSKKSLY